MLKRKKIASLVLSACVSMNLVAGISAYADTDNIDSSMENIEESIEKISDDKDTISENVSTEEEKDNKDSLDKC